MALDDRHGRAPLEPPRADAAGSPAARVFAGLLRPRYGCNDTSEPRTGQLQAGMSNARTRDAWQATTGSGSWPPSWLKVCSVRGPIFPYPVSRLGLPGAVSGIRARIVVPVPRGVSISSVPPSALTRSTSPLSPEPRVTSTPPLPSAPEHGGVVNVGP